MRIRVGDDLLVEDTVTRYGLRRKHIIRRGALPDVEAWKSAAPEGARVYWWTWKEEDDRWHLVICWKDRTK